MIVRLVVGAARSGETFMSGDAHPIRVKLGVRTLHRSEGPAVVVATWSPIVIDEVLGLWEGAGTVYDRILLRGASGDLPLASIKDPDWLAFFSIGDLLARGEFDQWFLEPCPV